MPNLVNNDVLLYTINYEQGGQRYMNTAYYKYTDSFLGNDDYAVLCNAFLSAKEVAGNFISDLKEILADSVTIIDHRMQRVAQSRLAPVIHPLNEAGEVSAAELPGNSAACVTRRTILGTRWAIGSWHQPGLTADALFNATNLNSTYMTNLEVMLNTRIRGVAQPGGSFGNIENVLWSPSVPLRFTPITAYVCQPTPRVMRRRTVGLGI